MSPRAYGSHSSEAVLDPETPDRCFPEKKTNKYDILRVRCIWRMTPAIPLTSRGGCDMPGSVQRVERLETGETADIRVQDTLRS